MDVCLALDVGGSKMAAGLVTRSGDLLVHERVETPSTGDPEALFAALRSVVAAIAGAEAGASPSTRVVAGIGCGGPMDLGQGTVSPLNIPGWRDFPLRSRVAALTGLPTALDNDAKALALGEGWVGAARGCRNFLAMVVSTGVGGGIVLDGRLLGGRLGNAGHIGHVVVVPEGRRCVCGGRGCLEAEASGTAIAALTGRPADVAPPYMVERTGTLVGRAVASVVNLLDLPLAVVSGSVALGFGPPFFEAAQREVDLRCGLDYARGARVIAGGLGDRGPLIGAGCVGWRHVEASA
jgi:glucokinase